MSNKLEFGGAVVDLATETLVTVTPAAAGSNASFWEGAAADMDKLTGDDPEDDIVEARDAAPLAQAGPAPKRENPYGGDFDPDDHAPILGL